MKYFWIVCFIANGLFVGGWAVITLWPQNRLLAVMVAITIATGQIAKIFHEGEEARNLKRLQEAA